MALAATQELASAVLRLRLRTVSESSSPTRNPTNRPTTGITNIPTTAPTTPKSSVRLGMARRLSLLLVSTRLEDSPAISRVPPRASTIHPSGACTTNAQITSPISARMDPGSTGITIPTQPTMMRATVTMVAMMSAVTAPSYGDGATHDAAPAPVR